MRAERIRVLLIEDDPGDARLVRHFAAEAPGPRLRIEMVGDLSSGLARLREPGVDVVLLDLSLPDSFGLETLKSVLAVDAGVPVVVLTGLQDAEIAAEAVREGAQDYLPKSDLSPGLLSRSVQYAIDRKKASDALLELSRRLQHVERIESLGVLAGGVAHDLNSILTGLLCEAESARWMLLANSPVAGHLQRIEAAAQRAAEMASQMLAYSGKGHFTMQEVSLASLVRDLEPVLRTVVPSDAALTLSLSTRGLTVHGSPDQLRQLVTNLVRNAAEALESGQGSITVSVEPVTADRAALAGSYLDEGLPPGEYVALQVSDTGCGMDDATRQRIFDPFFTTHSPGRGLGLAAVLGIVRGHRGAIKAVSEPGRGTGVTVLLPAAPCACEGAASGHR